MRASTVPIFAVALAAAIAGCDPASSRDSTQLAAPANPSFEDLPSPSWRVIARRDGSVLLAAVRSTNRSAARSPAPGRGEIATQYSTLIYSDGALTEGPAATLALRVIGEGAQPDSLTLYSVPFAGRAVFFAQDSDLSASLLESPAEPGKYLYERRDELWLISDSVVTLLTADTIAGFHRDSLRARTSEGGPILYWATQPRWSADGELIAYLTNRSWMLTADGGQEIWIVNVRTLEDRPLLSESGETFSTTGWLDDELLFTSRSGGISAVNIRTGIRRSITGDVVEDVSADGSLLLYSTGGPDSLSMHVLSEGAVLDIPAPPAGERYDHGAAFAPNGKQLLLATSFAADSGMTRALHLFELDANRLTRIMQWNFREGTRHPQGMPVWLDDSTLLLTEAERGGGAAGSKLVKLR